MRTVPSTEFSKNFGRYRDVAQREPVAVTSHDRVSGYFISDIEYALYLKLKPFLPTSLAAQDLPDETLELFSNTKMNPSHNHLNSLLEE